MLEFNFSESKKDELRIEALLSTHADADKLMRFIQAWLGENKSTSGELSDQIVDVLVKIDEPKGTNGVY